jgi:hypothetical protein
MFTQKEAQMTTVFLGGDPTLHHRVRQQQQTRTHQQTPNTTPSGSIHIVPNIYQAHKSGDATADGRATQHPQAYETADQLRKDLAYMLRLRGQNPMPSSSMSALAAAPFVDPAERIAPATFGLGGPYDTDSFHDMQIHAGYFGVPEQDFSRSDPTTDPETIAIAGSRGALFGNFPAGIVTSADGRVSQMIIPMPDRERPSHIAPTRPSAFINDLLRAPFAQGVEGEELRRAQKEKVDAFEVDLQEAMMERNRLDPSLVKRIHEQETFNRYRQNARDDEEYDGLADTVNVTLGEELAEKMERRRQITRERQNMALPRVAKASEVAHSTLLMSVGPSSGAKQRQRPTQVTHKSEIETEVEAPEGDDTMHHTSLSQIASSSRGKTAQMNMQRPVETPSVSLPRTNLDFLHGPTPWIQGSKKQAPTQMPTSMPTHARSSTADHLAPSVMGGPTPSVKSHAVRMAASPAPYPTRANDNLSSSALHGHSGASKAPSHAMSMPRPTSSFPGRTQDMESIAAIPAPTPIAKPQHHASAIRSSTITQQRPETDNFHRGMVIPVQTAKSHTNILPPTLSSTTSREERMEPAPLRASSTHTHMGLPASSHRAPHHKDNHELPSSPLAPGPSPAAKSVLFRIPSASGTGRLEQKEDVGRTEIPTPLAPHHSFRVSTAFASTPQREARESSSSHGRDPPASAPHHSFRVSTAFASTPQREARESSSLHGRDPPASAPHHSFRVSTAFASTPQREASFQEVQTPGSSTSKHDVVNVRSSTLDPLSRSSDGQMRAPDMVNLRQSVKHSSQMDVARSVTQDVQRVREASDAQVVSSPKSLKRSILKNRPLLSSTSVQNETTQASLVDIVRTGSADPTVLAPASATMSVAPRSTSSDELFPMPRMEAAGHSGHARPTVGLARGFEVTEAPQETASDRITLPSHVRLHKRQLQQRMNRMWESQEEQL